MKNSEKLYTSLGYIFQKNALLENALTHRSYSATHNERLEFLGDSLLNCIIAEALYERYPKAAEGDLSQLRSFLVKEETLAEVAKTLDLGSFLKLGHGESKTGGATRPSTLADALEATIAAIFLDSHHNFDLCKQCVLHLFKDKLNSISLTFNNKDPKTQLQEYLQSKKLGLPIYKIVSFENIYQNQKFKISCQVKGFKQETFGDSSNRRKAEQLAAQAFLTYLTKKK